MNTSRVVMNSKDAGTNLSCHLKKGLGSGWGGDDESNVLTVYKAKDKKKCTCVCTHRHTHKRQKVVRSWRAL